MDADNRTWQDLCRAASKEHDPELLLELVAEIVKALDEQKLPPNAARPA